MTLNAPPFRPKVTLQCWHKKLTLQGEGKEESAKAGEWVPLLRHLTKPITETKWEMDPTSTKKCHMP